MLSFRTTGLRTVAVAALVAGTPALAQDQQPADLIVTNAGTVFTGADDQSEATAFAVRDGLFVEIGDDADMDAYRGDDTQVIDADGRTVIPGLNDSHSHQIRGGRFYNLETRWDGIPTLKEALDRIRTEAERVPEGEWVRVIGGWSPYQFEEQRMPTVEELNEAAPDTPVFVLFLYSQGFLNQAGVEALGYTPRPRPPTDRGSSSWRGAARSCTPSRTRPFFTAPSASCRSCRKRTWSTRPNISIAS